MTKPKKRKLYIVRKTLATILLSVLVISMIVAGFALNMVKGMIAERPELDIARLETPESTLVYDANGELFAEIGLKLSDNIAYDDLPNVVVDAFVAIEDAKFFDHEGFDLARFTNESLQTVRRFLSGGSFGAGASTITMQIIKNSIFSDDDNLAPETVDRKAQEISLAMDLEEISTKEQIIEFYLNKINFGVPKSRGIAKAALYYFNKSVGELNLSEAAYLAGVINEPTNLNAYNHLQAGTDRRNVVLDLMLRHGYITQEERDMAVSIKLENQLWGDDKYYGDIQPHSEYLDVVIEEMQDVYGIDPYLQGMKIYTALNPSQQNLIESIEDNNYEYYYDDKIDAAYVTLNNQTGEIIAIGGGRKFPEQDRVQRAFNNALSLTRQPGSVLKPILPYSLSFEYLGYSTQHVIEDGPYAYIGSPVFVFNANGQFAGDITLEDAVIKSLNIPALKTMDALLSGDGIGYERVTNYLTSLGIDPQTAQNVNSAYSIGGGLFTATPLQVAGAHAAMINKGQYIRPHTITRIEIEGRDPIYPNFEPVQVISPEAAYLTATVMKAAVDAPFGTGTAASMNQRPYPVYSKTGTSDHGDEFEAYGIREGTTKDAWHAASTNQYTHVVWNGFKQFINDDGTPNFIADPWPNAQQVAQQSNLLLDNAETFHEPTAIERPAGVVDIRHVLGVYPYVAPVSGMNQEYIANGLIIDKFSRLDTLKAAELANLSSQSVSLGTFDRSGLEVNVQIDSYPDDVAVSSQDRTKVMTATNSLGETMTRTGRQLFHPSWMFGSINYGTEITLNGNVVETVIDSNKDRTIKVSNARSNQNLQVCSFYTWSSRQDSRSNQICETINTGNQMVEMPDFVGRPIAEAEAWITENTSAGITRRAITPNSRDQLGMIQSISPNYANQEVSQSNLDRANFTITYYDGEVVNLQSYVGRSVRVLQNDLGRLFTLSGPTDNPNARITSILADGQAISTFNISEVSTITFTVEQAQPEPTPEPEPNPGNGNDEGND